MVLWMVGFRVLAAFVDPAVPNLLLIGRLGRNARRWCVGHAWIVPDLAAALLTSRSVVCSSWPCAAGRL